VPLTNSQIDRLGDRLRRAAQAGGPIPEADKHLLLELRASFLPAYQAVVVRIRDEVGVKPSGRPEKTPESIIAKLDREGTQLSRMQDIAGCRIVVPSRERQDEVLARLRELFPERRETDRRAEPRYGYRAVHVIVRQESRAVEIQVRTALQDAWAQLVESMSSYGGDLKHGIEPPEPAGLLAVMVHASQAIAEVEDGGHDVRLTAGRIEQLIPLKSDLANIVRDGMMSTYREGLFWGIMASALVSRRVAL
jgi:Region found in RelA / SpoT proteins